MEFHHATLLTPDNLFTSLSLTGGKKKFLDFYSQSFPKQRECLADVVSKTLDFDRDIIQAIHKIPLEVFVPWDKRSLSYWNGVTWYRGLAGTTPPWLCAFACYALGLRPGLKVLTIGFGYGYLETIMSEAMHNGSEVYSIEIDSELLRKGTEITREIGYNSFHLKLGDGLQPYDGESRFDAIWPTLGTTEIPSVWVDQLKERGKLAVFRPFSKEEFGRAKNVEWEGWAGKASDYSEYMHKWWADLCLAIYEDEKGILIPVSQLYEMDNPPIYHSQYGTTEPKDWGKGMGKWYETYLLNVLRKAGVRPSDSGSDSSELRED
jgi:protein-L-isoaspartate(D-aspartate) O-methyltransferase